MASVGFQPSFYVKLGSVCFLVSSDAACDVCWSSHSSALQVGGAMEMFMIKTGFYDK